MEAEQELFSIKTPLEEWSLKWVSQIKKDKR
jgi:hypothetical protein